LRTCRPTRGRENFFGIVDRRARRGAGSLGGEDASIVALNLLCRHEHPILVATQDGRLGEDGEGVGFELCMSTRFARVEAFEEEKACTYAWGKEGRREVCLWA
jgi:hypothetical protein